MKQWVQSLNNKDRESFLEFCKKTVSPVQIYLFSRFLGFQGTIVECNEWSEKEFKKRNFNLVLETEIDNMREDIAKLRQAIDMGLVKQDMGAARIAMLQKELRGAIKQLDDKNIFNAPVTIIDPKYDDNDNRLITTFFNPFEAADYLTFKRKRKS